jgi:hypothetical protein
MRRLPLRLARQMARDLTERPDILKEPVFPAFFIVIDKSRSP